MARTVAGERKYLLVEAHRSRVCAEVIARAGESEHAVDEQIVRVIFFLMRYQGEARRREPRARAWHRYEDALRLLRFDDTRRVLMQAHALQR